MSELTADIEYINKAYNVDLNITKKSTILLSLANQEAIDAIDWPTDKETQLKEIDKNQGGNK